jgi:hypothetical protein
MIRKLPPIFTSTVLAILAGTSVVMAEPKPAGKPDAKKNGPASAADKKGTQQQVEQKADDTAKGLGAIGTILPVGQKNLDARMPSFRDGKPSSLIEAGSMTRMDEDHMIMEKVHIRLYGATQDEDLHVQLHSGDYDMKSQVLDSHERSRVSRNDFQLEGDSMVFDTRTQQGKMVGHVHMIIFDGASLTKKPLMPAKQNAANPAATPQGPAGANPAKTQK